MAFVQGVEMNIQKENYRIAAEQERLLIFDHFNHQDAWALGSQVVIDANELNIAIACDVWLNNFQVFRYGIEGTGQFHDLWLKRKMRTVTMFEKSSLRVHCMPYVGEDDLVKDAYLDPNIYSIMGGGFPIHVKNTGMVGVLCVAGGTHTQDHQIAANAIAKRLDVTIDQVLDDRNGKLLEV